MVDGRRREFLRDGGRKDSWGKRIGQAREGAKGTGCKELGRLLRRRTQDGIKQNTLSPIGVDLYALTEHRGVAPPREEIEN